MPTFTIDCFKFRIGEQSICDRDRHLWERKILSVRRVGIKGQEEVSKMQQKENSTYPDGGWAYK